MLKMDRSLLARKGKKNILALQRCELYQRAWRAQGRQSRSGRQLHIGSKTCGLEMGVAEEEKGRNREIQIMS